LYRAPPLRCSCLTFPCNFTLHTSTFTPTSQPTATAAALVCVALCLRRRAHTRVVTIQRGGRLAGSIQLATVCYRQSTVMLNTHCQADNRIVRTVRLTAGRSGRRCSTVFDWPSSTVDHRLPLWPGTPRRQFRAGVPTMGWPPPATDCRHCGSSCLAYTRTPYSTILTDRPNTSSITQQASGIDASG
jgi:hypothetical protein